MNGWGESWESEQRAKSEKRKIIEVYVAICLCVCLLIAAGIVLKPILFPVHTALQSVDTAYDVVDEVMDKDAAIDNYEWFKKQEAYIWQCLKNEVIAKEEWDNFKKDLPEDREKWTRDDKTEESSLRNSYYALQKLTNKAIEDYNANASMVTKNIFRDNLPSNIDRALYAGKELTE
jgi:hypothetical protein